MTFTPSLLVELFGVPLWLIVAVWFVTAMVLAPAIGAFIRFGTEVELPPGALPTESDAAAPASARERDGTRSVGADPVRRAA